MSSGLRERKKAETRAALQDAAIELSLQHGVDNVSVETIAEAAGVSPRTFFNYFPSKEDAIVGSSTEEPSPLLELLRARPAGEEPLEALRRAVQGATERLQDDPHRWAARRLLVQRHPALAARHAAWLAEVEHVLVVEIADRLGLDPDHDLYPGTVVGAAMAATRIAITVWRNDDHAAPLATLVDETFDHLVAGLARPT